MLENNLINKLKIRLPAVTLATALNSGCFTEPTKTLVCEGQCTVHLCSFNRVPVLQNMFSPEKGAVIYGLEVRNDSIKINGERFDRYLHQVVRAINNDSVLGFFTLNSRIENGNVNRFNDSLSLTYEGWFRMYGTRNPNGLTLRQEPLYGVNGEDTITFHDGNGLFEYRLNCQQDFRLP